MKKSMKSVKVELANAVHGQLAALVADRRDPEAMRIGDLSKQLQVVIQRAATART